MFVAYLRNCFWLIVPVILLNILLARRLPRLYRPEVFDNIPNWISVIENILRIVVFLSPLLMSLEIEYAKQKLGLTLYAIGFVLYSLSWVMQIRFPHSTWSSSRFGFMAPAYTPALWLVGISLIGRSLFLPIKWSPWMYTGVVAGFLVFHNVHCWIAYSRASAPTP